ncbi:hypothetical protein OEZ60_04705 [Defluviimonas sp. WL0024]|uniref:Bacterial transcriptional activator domain-containing protein n=1 Tax=Albidovulum salinarum TaxID=2984153 RepID=A0ABT2X668_9RHOB|nr:BTAD domain-containing putative transcriptional regulator [Defluviimonas sp. WL0024]MCU9847300.1 hypothetical protein [Defluviimonas sp. WL0024]
MAKLQVQLLGTLKVGIGGRDPLPLPRKVRALVAWLALQQGRPMGREAASDLLWGDSAQKQASASLSQAIYALRKALGDHADVLSVNPETICLSTAGIKVDVPEFSRRARSSDHDDLLAARELYAGPFLDGFPAPTPAFADWQLAEERRLRLEAIDALTRLLALQTAQGREEEMVATAHRLQDLDPYSETAARSLMSHHATAGQIGPASDEYERLRESLADELGTEPEAETTGLYQRILDERSAPKRAAHEPRPERPAPGPRRGFWMRVACAALLALLAAGAFIVQTRPEFQPVDAATMAYPLPDKPSIAVLAFDDLSAGADQGYLSDAISEGIIHHLSRFSELFVIARNSSFHYRDTATDARKIARELGVRYILEGSQQKDGDRLRITAQLIDALEGNHVWSQRYDSDILDLFAVQDEITNTVAATVAGSVLVRTGEEAKRADPATLNAYQLQLQAQRHFGEFTRDGTEKARQANLAALRADPTFSQAYVGLTYVHLNGYRWGWSEFSREDALEAARETAQKALDLAPDDYTSHEAMAYVHVQAGELDAAIVRYETALEFNPNATKVMAMLSEPLGYAGRTEEAEELVLRASRLDPFHPDWYEWNLGWIRWLRGDCDGALRAMNEISRMPPLARRDLAIIHVCRGDLDAARREIGVLLDTFPDYSVEAVRLNFRGKYRDPADEQRYLDDLRTAGLPETAATARSKQASE